MKRTPRSASRRARMQFAAKEPGFRESGPYISKVVAGSFERSVNSGTEVCIRYAISYCAMRVGDLRVLIILQLQPVQLGQIVEKTPPRLARITWRIRQIQYRDRRRSET